jgi:sirohydrochlorin ferrochelatase
MTMRKAMLAAAVALGAATAWAQDKGADHSQMDHSQMDHSQMDHAQMDHSAMGHDMGRQPMDAEGRRKSAMAHSTGHKMGGEVYEEMRRNIPTYRALTDNEMDLAMGMMGDDMEWYVSDRSLTGELGVLLLAHGTGGGGDRVLRDAVAPLAKTTPTAIGFGMAMMASDHLQAAVDDLEAAGAKTIVVVPTTATDHNSLKRQWNYIFGLGDKVAYATVPRVTAAKARLVVAPSYGFHPIMARILLDHAKEISTNPAKEVVYLVSHGPEEPADNEPDLANLQLYADHVKAQGGFADARALNLQDDALPAIRAGNVKKLRRWIETARRQGKDALIVAAVHQAKGIQQKIYSDLDGLTFRYNEKGMSNHPAFVEWVKDAVKTALADKG